MPSRRYPADSLRISSCKAVPRSLAREIQDAYAYTHGLWNTALSHNDQTQIVDSNDSDE